MHGKVKLSQREIKEDKFTSFVLTTREQFMESWQYIVIGVVVIVLGVAGVFFWMNNRDKQQAEAGAKLSTAMGEYQRNNVQVALLGLGQVVENYSGDAVEQATFMLGKLNLESRNYVEARKYFDSYLSKYSGNKLLRAASIAGLGGCLEGEDKYGEAAAKYVAAVNEYPGGPQEGEFQTAAMRDYLSANDLPNAQARLDEIRKNFKGTDKVYRAELLFAEKTSTR